MVRWKIPASGAAFCFALLVATASQAAEPIYIEDFTAEQPGSDAPSDKVEKNAAALSEALVKALNDRGFPAYRLGAADPAPQAGRVISGVFSETLPGGPFSQISSIGNSTPNSEVTLNIVEDGKSVGTIDMAASLGGQGKSLSINPYVIAAKLVIHHVASDRSIDDFAKRLADRIAPQT